MAVDGEQVRREVLSIPDTKQVRLTTFEATDPGTNTTCRPSQRIISARGKGAEEMRPSTDEPGSFGKAFTQRWKRTLDELDAVFKKA